LVIKTHFTKSLAQFLGELMQRLQMISCGRNLSLRILEELLVALVDQAGNLSTHQITWLGKNADAAVLGPLDGGGAVVLLQEDAVLRAGRVQDVEFVLAKPAHGLFVRARLGLFWHDSPIAGWITGAFPAVAPKEGEPILSHIGCTWGNVTLVSRAVPHSICALIQPGDA